MKYLIAGLGNIGSEYENTRHNIGFVVLDALAMDLKATFSTGRLASVAEAKFKGRTLVLVKPTTYMNLSGKAVKYWLNHEKLGPESLMVVHDDKDLPLASVRVRKNGSGGTHNGMNDIIFQLLTEDFPRLRFGIGNDFARGYQVDYVLGKWSREEEKILLERIPIAVEVIKSFVTQGVDRTMNLYNNK
jgi:PTH1 family peptidyl-tRNA hydrolase